MKMKKGDQTFIHLDIVISCLEKEEVEIDLDDLKKFLYAAIDIYKESNDL